MGTARHISSYLFDLDRGRNSLAHRDAAVVRRYGRVQQHFETFTFKQVRGAFSEELVLKTTTCKPHGPDAGAMESPKTTSATRRATPL